MFKQKYIGKTYVWDKKYLLLLNMELHASKYFKIILLAWKWILNFYEYFKRSLERNLM